MTSPHTPITRAHKRTPVAIEVIVNGVLNQIEGHYGGQVVYAIVMWSEFDRMGVRFPYELSHGPLFNALERARSAASAHPAQIFLSNRSAGFGRRGLS